MDWNRQGMNASDSANGINTLGQRTKLCTIWKESGNHMTYEQLSLMTFQPQTSGVSASRAKTSASQANKKDCKKVSEADCFMKLCDCLPDVKKKIDPDGWSLKMLRIYLALETDLTSRGCSLKWGGYGYSLQWQVLNSKDFGVPQNRERVFIVGYLGDIRGREVFPLRPADGENPCELKEITGGLSMFGRIYDTDGISRTLAAAGGGGGAKTGLYAVKVLKPYGSTGGTCGLQITENETGIAAPCAARDYKGISRNKGDAVLVRFRYPERGEGSREKGYMEQVDCASALTSKHCGDQTADCSNGVLVAPVLTPDRKVRRQNGRWMKEPGEPSFTLTSADRHGVAIYQRPRGYNKGDMHDIAPALSINAWQENNLLTDSVRIRRLTPRECWRLQGFPDEYFDKAKAAGISDTQLYKQAGNSVTVNVARAIGERLKEVVDSHG